MQFSEDNGLALSLFVANNFGKHFRKLLQCHCFFMGYGAMYQNYSLVIL
jgi:hypothetical protein